MKRLQRAVVIASLIQEMKDRGSWCGETHVQKAVFFLQELLEVPTDYDFILYKHGPFSFDLRDEVTDFRAIGILKLQPMPFPYGPSLRVTSAANELTERYPKTLKKFKNRIDFVAEALGNKGVAQLERLATALHVMINTDLETPDSRSQYINKLKPHVSLDLALAAVHDVDELAETSRTLRTG